MLNNQITDVEEMMVTLMDILKCDNLEDEEAFAEDINYPWPREILERMNKEMRFLWEKQFRFSLLMEKLHQNSDYLAVREAFTYLPLNIGRMIYYQGELICEYLHDFDEVDAQFRKWVELGISYGDTTAYNVMGCLHILDGAFEEGKSCFMKGCAEEHEAAAYNLFLLERIREGTPLLSPMMMVAMCDQLKDAMKGYLYMRKCALLMFEKTSKIKAYETFRFCSLGAERGDAVLMTALGWLYYGGNGCRKNRKKAEKWFEEAAKLGCKRAKQALKTIRGLE